jgi:hypothetical protein
MSNIKECKITRLETNCYSLGCIKNFPGLCSGICDKIMQAQIKVMSALDMQISEWMIDSNYMNSKHIAKIIAKA